MQANRREILGLVAAGAAAGMLARSVAYAASGPEIKAVAFDAFPIFDPRPVFGLAKNLYPEKGDAFVAAFQTSLFEYQWLRALGSRYKDFFSIIDDAHVSTAQKLGLNATNEGRDAIAKAFLGLKAWPDVAASLKALRDKGIRLAFLSNMTPQMLNAGIANSGLEGVFEFVLSTDLVKSFKPDPRAYQLGVDAFKLPKEQIAFTAFAGWDVAGATWFGYPTVWVNRLNSKPEGLDATPAATGPGLDALVKFAIPPA
jgi:2-haloacid dehalogenase